MRKGERSLFDEALAYYESTVPPGGVLRFRGKPVKDIVWTEREKIRVILEYQKDTKGFASRNGHVTIFAPTIKAESAAKG